jgi:hypothetical protein
MSTLTQTPPGSASRRNAPIVSLAGALCALAVTAPRAAASELPLMDREKEIALALTACPASLADAAGVYVLERGGYVRARESRNGFNALVQHSRPGAQEPQCMDAEGSRTILRRYLQVAVWQAAGKTPEEIKTLTDAAFASGAFPAIARPGVDYMLSPQNRVSNFRGEVTYFPPHVMFFGTKLTNPDLGVGKTLGPDGNPTAPAYVAGEGSPYSMIIVPVATGGHVHDMAEPRD